MSSSHFGQDMQMLMQAREVMDAMQNDADFSEVKLLRVDGGASHNDLLMQMQANALQVWPMRVLTYSCASPVLQLMYLHSPCLATLLPACCAGLALRPALRQSALAILFAMRSGDQLFEPFERAICVHVSLD